MPPLRHVTVPMEEIVRAFNFVIHQGWVRRAIHSEPLPSGLHLLEGDNHVFHRPRRRRPWPVRHAGAVLLKTARPTHMHTIPSSARPCRHCTGRLRNGQRTTSKKHTVRVPPNSVRFVRAELTFTCLSHVPPALALPDVASKLGLIAPIAEQCQHKCACLPSHARLAGASLLYLTLIFPSMFHRERPEKEYA